MEKVKIKKTGHGSGSNVPLPLPSMLLPYSTAKMEQIFCTEETY
jgi:hypothetical protein